MLIMRAPRFPVWMSAMDDEMSVSITPSAMPNSKLIPMNAGNAGMRDCGIRSSTTHATDKSSSVGFFTRPMREKDKNIASIEPKASTELGNPCREPESP